MRSLGREGQVLLLAVLLGALLLIAIPVIVFLNQIGTLHQVAAQKRIKGRAIAEGGVSFVTQQLSASLTQWQNALGGNFQAPAATDCNTGVAVPSLSGQGKFLLTCSVDPVANKNLQPYQVAVTAVALLPDRNGTQVATRAVKAYLSQRTLGTDFASGLHAAAALQLVNRPTTPAVTNSLVVHWGPIVCLDPGSGVNSWQLYDPLDHRLNTTPTKNFIGFPRKFTQGGLQAHYWKGSGPNPTYPRPIDTSVSAATTDQKEYFTFASQTFVPTIDEAYYIGQAQNASNFTNPFWPTPGPFAPSQCATTQCSYFDVGASTAVFDGTLPGYTVPSAGSVVWVNGNAEFDRVAIDVSTFVITGNLTLGNPSTGGTAAMGLHVPNSAHLEYYYWLAAGGPSWPCHQHEGKPGYTSCSSTQADLLPAANTNVQFRGFLYVKGNLIVTQPNWNLVGSVQVGDRETATGQLIVNAGSNLTVVYDDLINHQIHVNPVAGTSIKVVPDILQDTPIP